MDDTSGAVVPSLSAKLTTEPGPSPALICFSHLRWHFVFQRPQHLLMRAAQTYRVFFWEEPVEADGPVASLDVTAPTGGVLIMVPHIPRGMNQAERIAAQRALLDAMIAEHDIVDPLLWYYTPQAMTFAKHLTGQAVVYDCMDELSGFQDADPAHTVREQQLLARSDVVFTGGFSLYEAKRRQHHNVHPFPSGVDVQHFLPAREGLKEPDDQAHIPHPRLGFYGVMDERLDQALLAHLADARPDWQIVLVGPVVKIDQGSLTRRPNIHYLGIRTYQQLPAYVAGWDVALMPFALNEATRFISPTKTPEYLAAGRPVVSTAVADVVRQYGGSGAVLIADSPDQFVGAVQRALDLSKDRQSWMPEVDKLLATSSWDSVWHRMSLLVPPPGGKANQPALRPGSRSPGGSATARPYDVMIVGAGFAGAVLAERFASTGRSVLLLDRREHVGGNAYDHHDAAGLLVHRYGPHIFHTNSQQIFAYLSRFTKWRPYEHRVLARVGDSLLPIPINRTTVNRFFGLSLAEGEVAGFLAGKAERVPVIRSSEDVVLSSVGRELYEAFFRNYTRKQWGVDPSELDKSVTSRIPTRTNDDDRYFGDTYQVMPRDGYTRMFENMLDHPNINLMLGVDFRDARHDFDWNHLVFTGPVDEYFDYCHGPLPYRSLRFEHQTFDAPVHQPVAVVNYPSASVPYTRVTEFKHLTGQLHRKTSICHEYPTAEGDPYYPIPRPENAALYARYQALADATPDVTFVGRLATYRYYNMDQVVGQALTAFQRLAERDMQATASARLKAG